jgi:hypothetical protein
VKVAGQGASVRRSWIIQRVAASLATSAAAIGSAAFATLGSFDGADPFPHSVLPAAGADR